MTSYPTIRDVARLAGVSVQTVSRVLNDRSDVAEATRTRVRLVIAELAYVPIAAARSLPRGHRPAVGVVTHPSFVADHFYARAIEGCLTEVSRHGYAPLIVPVAPDGSDAQAAIDRVVGHRVAGVVVARRVAMYTEPFLEATRRLRVPIVAVGFFRDPARQMMSVDMDSRHAGAAIARHLLRLGHRRIAVIRGYSRHGGADARMAGHLDALAELGIRLDDELIESSDWELDSGAPAIRALLQRATDFTAVVCHHDHVALGAIRALHVAGRQTPGDVAVVGLEDLLVAPYLDPALTTYRVPAREIGVRAVRTALGLEPISVEPTLLTGQLIVRESCGAPASQRTPAAIGLDAVGVGGG